MSDRAELPAFVGSADALTAVFENLEIMLAGYRP